MKKLFIFLFFLSFSNLYALEIKLEKIVDSLDKPWSLSFIDQENVIFTEKSGKLYTLNLKDKLHGLFNPSTIFSNLISEAYKFMKTK